MKIEYLTALGGLLSGIFAASLPWAKFLKGSQQDDFKLILESYRQRLEEVEADLRKYRIELDQVHEENAKLKKQLAECIEVKNKLSL